MHSSHLVSLIIAYYRPLSPIHLLSSLRLYRTAITKPGPKTFIVLSLLLYNMAPPGKDFVALSTTVATMACLAICSLITRSIATATHTRSSGQPSQSSSIPIPGITPSNPTQPYPTPHLPISVPPPRVYCTVCLVVFTLGLPAMALVALYRIRHRLNPPNRPADFRPGPTPGLQPGGALPRPTVRLSVQGHGHGHVARRQTSLEVDMEDEVLSTSPLQTLFEGIERRHAWYFNGQ